MMRAITRIAVLPLSIVLCLIVIFGATADPANETEIEVMHKQQEVVTSVIITEPLSVTSTTRKVEEPIEEIWPYPISQNEIDLIALVTMAEAEGETELGKRLVIDTILNRMDDPHFPDTVYDVIYYPNAFSSMWNGRVDRCQVMPEIVELVKEELLERTNYECVFFTAGGYSTYGVPMFQEDNHYFSSYE